MIRLLILLLCSCSVLILSCEKSPKNVASFTDIKEIPLKKWEMLGNQRIFFGHQSVGYNILSGIQDIQRDHPEIKIFIKEKTDEALSNTALWTHAKVGKNKEPKLKIQAFDKVIRSNGSPFDIAFLKLCYLDIAPDTDVEKLFHYYKEVFDTLQRDYPETHFMHVTVPLVVLQTGPKAWIKKMLGRPVRGQLDNIKRFKFNERLRETYIKSGQLFDLAAIESTYPDGRRSSFVIEGRNYYSLVPDYTSDGGHLNELGRKIVAEKLLLFLANMA